MGTPAKTRQANYRRRKWLADVSRLELMLADSSIRKLNALAAQHGVSRAVIVGRLIAGAERCLTSVIGDGCKLPKKLNKTKQTVTSDLQQNGTKRNMNKTVSKVGFQRCFQENLKKP